MTEVHTGIPSDSRLVTGLITGLITGLMTGLVTHDWRACCLMRLVSSVTWL
jgi:hypothetical protein